MKNIEYDFTGKYTKEGKLGRALVDRFYRRVFECLVSVKYESCLEIGSGNGFSTKRISEEIGISSKFESCDVEPRLVSAARGLNPNINIFQKSIYDFDGSEHYDVVLLLEVLEHLDDPFLALERVKNLKFKYLIASVPNEPLWKCLNFLRGKYVRDFGNTPGHIQAWSTNEFSSLLQNFGTIKKIFTPLPWSIIMIENND